MTLESVIGGVLGGTAVSGIVVAWVTHRFSQGRFVSKRWWERKATAYSEVMEHLAKLRVALIDCIDALDEETAPESLEELMARWNQAGETLGVIANQDTFLLSAPSLACLARIQRSFEGIKDGAELQGALKTCALAVRQGVAELSQCAHEDLGVERGRPRQAPPAGSASLR